MEGEGFCWDEYRGTLTATVAGGMARGASVAALRRALAAATALAEGVLTERRRGPGEMRIACGPGCGTCCAVYVSVLIPEAIAIAAHLRERLPPEALALLRARLDEECRRLRWVDAEERVRLGIPCVFLDADGRCTIYPVRPLTCRSVTSTDAELCRRALSITCLDEEEPVVMDLFQKFLFDETFTTAAAALAGLGLDARSRELTAAVRVFLDVPARATAFLRGERLAWE